MKERTRPELVSIYNDTLRHLGGDEFKEDGGEIILVDSTDGKEHQFKIIKSFQSVAEGEKRVHFLERLAEQQVVDDNTAAKNEKDVAEVAAGIKDNVSTRCREIFESLEVKDRSEALALCVKAGINKSTAATQWQKFRKEGNKVAENEVAKPKGACAQIREYCAENKKLAKKELVDNLAEQGFNRSTVNIQVGKFLKENPRAKVQEAYDKRVQKAKDDAAKAEAKEKADTKAKAKAKDKE